MQALPVLRHLKIHFPESEIFWWVEPGFAPLLQSDPDLAGIFPFDKRRWAYPWNWPELGHAVRTVREQKFDWVIDLQSLMRSGLVAWFANGGLTVGLDDAREGARGFYDIIVPRSSYFTHAVDWYLEALRYLKVPLAPKIDWLPENARMAEIVQRKWDIEAARWVILQPGARWANKRWPLEHFAELTRRIGAERPDHRFAILGSSADAALGETLSRALPGRCLDLTGQTTLLEMVELIRRSELMVTNDTGPMHIAAALGTPVVGVFGPTEARRTGPYGQVENAVRIPLGCAPCMKSRCRYEKPLECMWGLSAENVSLRALQLLPS